MIRGSLRRVILLMLLMLGLYGIAHGQQGMRVAFVNTPEVLEQAPQAEAVRNTLQAEFAPRDANLVAEQQKIRALEERLLRDAAVLSDEERRRLERDLLAQQRDLKRSRDEFGEDFNIRRNEELAKMQREIAESIMNLARERGYDLIIESGVVYASDRVDITKEVIARLKRDHQKTRP
ncbi:MAG: OmpH family outer membrane protein [Chromatiales bacterium]|nr:OmpH family outer membrane protein [Chromatiales bacterium]